MGKIESEGVSGGLADGRILGQGPQNHLSHRRGHTHQRRWRRVEVLVAQGMRGQRRIKQRRPDEQLVEKHTQGIEVGRRPQPAADKLFRRHVLRGPDEHARGGRGPVENLRNSEVGDLE